MKLPVLPVRMRQHAPVILMLISMAIALGAYLQATSFPFLSDDSFYITGNAKLAGLHLADLWRLFTEPYNPYEFLPLRDFSYWLDLALFGMNPAAFRLHNMLLYAACCLLVYAVTLKLWLYFRPAEETEAPWAAAAVAALFAIHPAHVEAVVWASGRKDVLSGLFALLALWFALGVRRGQGFSAWHVVAALAALLAAMLAKATALVMAPLIALLWFVFWRDAAASSRRGSMLLWPVAALLLAAAVAPVFIGHSTVKLPAYFGVEAYERALSVLGWLLRLAVSPAGRHYMYPVFEDAWLWGMVALGAVVLLAGVAGVLQLWRRRSIEGFALLSFVLLGIPYMQFSPYITHSLVTDRFLFLALWPVLLLLVALTWRLRQPVLRTLVLLAFLLPWTFQTVERPRDWRSYQALVDVDLHAYPGYYAPIFQNVEKYLSQGQYRDAREFASGISDPEIRGLVTRLVDGASAVAVESVQSGDPRDALARLQELGPLLREPLPRSRWNTPLFSFWLSSRDLLMLEWQTLAKNFPDDAAVRREARMRQEAGL
jgi:hypothetical protein